MIHRPLIVALALAAGFFACGKSGDNSSDDGNGPVDDGGVIDDNPKNVTGRFFFENTDNPAAGLDLVLADWTSLSMKTFTTRSDGSVTLELSEFDETGRYSFHLIKDDRNIGDLDLSAVNSGLQSAFVYRGGYGFELGDVIIPKDERGVISVPLSGLQAAVGGGFSLGGSTGDLRIENFPMPDLVSSLDVRPSLIVSDPADLLFGFLNVLNSSETGRVLARYNGVSFQSVAKNIDDVTRIFVSREAPWHGSAKLLPADFSALSSARFWQTNSLYLTQTGADFAADVLPGISLINRLIFLKIEGQEPPQFEVPRLMDTGYSRPPLLGAISLSGGTPSAIDYTDGTAENGLTTPFCYTSGDIVGTYSVPRDLSDAALDGATFEQVVLSFDYFSQASGVTLKIDGSKLLPAPYNVDLAETQEGLYLLEWDSISKSLIRTMTAGSTSLTSHTMSIPEELLPSNFGGKTVTRIRIKVLFKSKNHPGKSGSVFWLKKGC